MNRAKRKSTTKKNPKSRAEAPRTGKGKRVKGTGIPDIGY